MTSLLITVASLECEKPCRTVNPVDLRQLEAISLPTQIGVSADRPAKPGSPLVRFADRHDAELPAHLFDYGRGSCGQAYVHSSAFLIVVCSRLSGW